jgi:hypothetical protein
MFPVFIGQWMTGFDDADSGKGQAMSVAGKDEAIQPRGFRPVTLDCERHCGGRFARPNDESASDRQLRQDAG